MTSRLFFGAWGFLLIPIFLTFVSGGCANEVLQGQVEAGRTREAELATQLEASRRAREAQDAVNAELLQKEAAFEQERLRAETEIARLSGEMETQRRAWETKIGEMTVENTRLSDENREAMQRITAQNASLERQTTEIIIPNNGHAATRLILSDGALLPPRRDGEDLIVEFQDHLIFSFDDDKLTDEGRVRLQTAAVEILRVFPENRFRIEGNFTEAEDVSDVLTASVMKAKRVADYLATDCGVSADRITVAGAGRSKPVVSSAAPEGRKRNRRVEWIILGGG